MTTTADTTEMFPAVVMNAITHDAAYSFFPTATFEDNVSIISAIRNAKEEAALEKYRSRGWPTIAIGQADHLENYRGWPHGQYRWMVDRCTWTLPLACNGHTGDRRARYEDSVHVMSFDFRNDVDQTASPIIQFTDIQTPYFPSPVVFSQNMISHVKSYESEDSSKQ